MQDNTIVKLTSRHSTAYVHRGRQLIEGRLLFEEILYPICDSIFEISATQLRFLTEIALKSPFLCVNRSPIAYGFSASAKAVRCTVNIAFKELSPGRKKTLHNNEVSVLSRCP